MSGKAYRIRPARESEVAGLSDIERAADPIYAAALGAPAPGGPTDPHSLARSHSDGLLWVAADAADRPVGFLAAGDLDGALYIGEMDVRPEHQRRGLGRALMAAALDHARWAFFPAAALTTDRFIPFNGPFYHRLGFVELRSADLSPGLKAALEAEIAAGYDPARRVAMAKRL